MFASSVALLASLASVAFVDAAPSQVKRETISVTPHMQYGSSIGVPGCKINTDLVAFWPSTVGCDDYCIRLTTTDGARSVKLLKIDASTGANDISWNAYAQLKLGQDITTANAAEAYGGGIDVTWETLPVSECNDLLPNGKLPLMAVPSSNYIYDCWSKDNTFADRIELVNIWNQVCTLGIDEPCQMADYASGANTPTCPSGFLPSQPLTGHPVYNWNQDGTKTVAIQ